MTNIRNGMLAGAAATAVLSMLMIMKAAMGLMPQLDLPAMLAKMMGRPGMPFVGWVVHAVIGIVGYGLVIALVDRGGEGNMTGRGVLIACIGWLIMMVVLMPMAGAGLFGLGMGIMAPIMTLILHLVFGAVLGSVYGALKRRAHTGSAA